MVSTAARPRLPHCDGLVDVAYKEFNPKILKPAKSIYFLLFSPPSQLDRPQNDRISPPCIPRRSRVLLYPPPIAPALIWLIVACSRRLAAAYPTTNFIIFIFPRNLMAQTMRQRPPQSSSPCAPSSPNDIQSFRPTFGWLLRPHIQQKPSKSKAPLLSLFSIFPMLNSPPKTTSKLTPPRVPPGCISSQTYPSPLTPLFG